MNNRITDPQRKRIFLLSKQAGISNADLHSYLSQWCGGDSLSSDHGITVVQANKVIEALTEIANKKGLVKNKPSPKQIKAIKAIQSALQWDKFRLERFIYHTCSKESLEALTIKEASAVIVGLNKVSAFLKEKSVKFQNQSS